MFELWRSDAAERERMNNKNSSPSMKTHEIDGVASPNNFNRFANHFTEDETKNVRGVLGYGYQPPAHPV